MIASFEDPGDPSGETEADDISSSSSEASDDEEEAPQSEEEAALDHIAGQWGPEPVPFPNVLVCSVLAVFGQPGDPGDKPVLG